MEKISPVGRKKTILAWILVVALCAIVIGVSFLFEHLGYFSISANSPNLSDESIIVPIHQAENNTGVNSQDCANATEHLNQQIDDEIQSNSDEEVANRLLGAKLATSAAAKRQILANITGLSNTFQATISSYVNEYERACSLSTATTGTGTSAAQGCDQTMVDMNTQLNQELQKIIADPSNDSTEKTNLIANLYEALDTSDANTRNQIIKDLLSNNTALSYETLASYLPAWSASLDSCLHNQTAATAAGQGAAATGSNGTDTTNAWQRFRTHFAILFTDLSQYILPRSVLGGYYNVDDLTRASSDTTSTGTGTDTTKRIGADEQKTSASARTFDPLYQYYQYMSRQRLNQEYRRQMRANELARTLTIVDLGKGLLTSLFNLFTNGEKAKSDFGSFLDNLFDVATNALKIGYMDVLATQYTDSYDYGYSPDSAGYGSFDFGDLGDFGPYASGAYSMQQMFGTNPLNTAIQTWLGATGGQSAQFVIVPYNNTLMIFAMGFGNSLLNDIQPLILQLAPGGNAYYSVIDAQAWLQQVEQARNQGSTDTTSSSSE